MCTEIVGNMKTSPISDPLEFLDGKPCSLVKPGIWTVQVIGKMSHRVMSNLQRKGEKHCAENKLRFAACQISNSNPHQISNF